MNSNFFKNTFKKVKFSNVFTNKNSFKTFSSNMNSQKIKINFLNLFYNQRICFLSKCTALFKVLNLPALIANSRAAGLELALDSEVNNSVAVSDGKIKV